MKFLIVLFVLAAIALCSSSEKINGRFSNIKSEQLLRNEKDNPSVGRSFYHKNKGGNQAPPSVYLIGLPTVGDYDQEEEFDINGDFDVVVSGRADYDDDDFLDSEDEVENEQTSIRNTKGNRNIKLKKINGKKQARRDKSPSMSRFENSDLLSSSATFKNGGNKLQMFRLNGKNNANKNSGNIALRRLFIQQ